MKSPSYVALSQQLVLRREMAVVANNIANVNTVGFKRQDIIFQEFIEEQKGQEPVSMVYDRATVRDISQGDLEQTGNELDLAISGSGYLAVQTPEGLAYTRTGRLHLSDSGDIVTSQGYPVLDSGNLPIAVPDGTIRLIINADGTMENQDGEFDEFNLVTFNNEQDMDYIGNGLYRTEQNPAPAEGVSIIQGVIEKSNVKPVIEMTRMIEVLRSYEATNRIIQSEHERMSDAIGKLGRIQ